MSVYLGVRSEKDVFYKAMFEKWAAAHPHLEFVLTLSRPTEAWIGTKGRVTALLPDLNFDPETTDVYLCGGKPMIDDVKQILLEKGFEKNHIFFEQFFL